MDLALTKQINKIDALFASMRSTDHEQLLEWGKSLVSEHAFDIICSPDYQDLLQCKLKDWVYKLKDCETTSVLMFNAHDYLKNPKNYTIAGKVYQVVSLSPITKNTLQLCYKIPIDVVNLAKTKVYMDPYGTLRPEALGVTLPQNCTEVQLLESVVKQPVLTAGLSKFHRNCSFLV